MAPNKLILNRASFDNFDPDNGKGSDRFAFDLTFGSGAVFRGFIGRHYVDDGWGIGRLGLWGRYWRRDDRELRSRVTISSQMTARLQTVICIFRAIVNAESGPS